MIKQLRTPPSRVTAKHPSKGAWKGWTRIFENRSARIAAVCLVALLAVACRFVNLDADPPVDVSWSQDLLTDPPQYSSYARTAVAHGSWNPLNDERLVFFRKNITGIFAYIVFTLFGPSVATANLTAVLLNLVAVGFLAWGVARAFGFLAGLGTAWVLAINYLFVSYGRQPFLEVASNACLAVAFWAIISSAKRWSWIIVGGLVAGAGTFFGKVTALHAAPVFILATLMQALDDDASVKGIARWRRPIGYLAGFGFVALLWYVFAYSAASDEVKAYLTEQSRTLYGAPVGLQSLSGFVRQFFSLGIDTRVLTWSPLAAIAGLVGIGGLLVWTVRHRANLPWWRQLSPAVFLTAGWFLCAYTAFSPFNYRPVRYQVVMWLPLAAAVGWLIQRLATTARDSGKSLTAKSHWWVFPILFAAVAIGLQHFVFENLLDPAGRGQSTSSHTASVIVGFLVTAGLLWFATRPPIGSLSAPRTRALFEVLVAIFFVGVVAEQGRHFIRWWNSPVHTIAQANADLPRILGPNAVVTGEWSAPLTQLAESPIGLTHFFSLQESKDFFAVKPITHVIVEDKQDGAFFKDFPELARRAFKVTNYTVGNLRIGVWRVSEVGGNAQAQSYQPTFIERLRMEPASRPLDSVLSDLLQRVADSADNYSGWAFAADLYHRADRKDEAATAYTKALEFYPDDFVILAQAGDLSWELYRTVGGPADRDRAVTLWQRALRVTPNNPQILERLRQVARS
jgi:4-amino-4-deoxy-L-arabinose transferase-like glycosyltransferase